MEYYFKKLGHQELGSIGANGKPQRGRYLLVSKREEVLELFPYLSKTEKNDSALLPVIPLYLKKKVYCNYVYHNYKYHGSTAKQPRDEFRIYLNMEFENNQYLFKENDIIIIKKDEIILEDDEKRNKDEQKVQTVYFLELLNNYDSVIYKFCDRTISESSIQGGYSLYDGRIPEMEDKITEIKNQGEVDVRIDNKVTKVISGGTEEKIAELFSSSSFRDFVLVGYSNFCAITGTVISWNTYNNLEAAHIRPRSHGGLYMPDNGIALCRDIHWAFDKGFFTIDDNLNVVVRKDIKSAYLNSFNGKKLATPINPFFAPNINNLRYHQEHIFGLFKITGRL